jgi:hypothetical protein
MDEHDAWYHITHCSPWNCGKREAAIVGVKDRTDDDPRVLPRRRRDLDGKQTGPLGANVHYDLNAEGHPGVISL